MFQDLRYSLRSLWKRPGFTVVVLATLALGIGVNAAIFSVFNILLRPLPVKEPESVVRLTFEEGSSRGDRFSFPDYSYIRDHNQSFSDVIAVFEEEHFLLGENRPNSDPEEIFGNFVSENYFATLGGSTQFGRFFTADENTVPGRDAVVVLTHGFWQRRFGGDPQLVGRSIKLNGKAFTVVGITHPEFVGLRHEMPDVWLPLAMRAAMATDRFETVAPEKRDWYGGRDFPWLSIYARLKPGRTAPEARAEMNVLWGRLDTDSSTAPRESIAVDPINDMKVPIEAWMLIGMVLGATGLILLIACFNIANMQLARAITRQKEIGVRLCLGATRWRLVRQLLTESLLLSVVGGVAGVLLAWWSLNLCLSVIFVRYGGAEMMRLNIDLSPDWRVLAYSFGLALLSGVAFGLIPALRATRPDLIGVVKSEGATATGRSARSRLSSALVVAQVAICFVLLIPAGLLLRSVQLNLTADPGYEAKNLLSVEYSLELSGYDAERAKVFQQQLMTRLAALPGVKSVSLDREFNGHAVVTLLDQGGGGANQFSRVPFEGIPSTYLDTIGTPLVLGRGFTADEVNARAPVLIVSESTARNLWPGQSALGKLLRIEQPLRDGGTEVIFSSAEVVGVSRDNQIYRSGETPSLLVYVPGASVGEMDTRLLVRTTMEAEGLKELARREAYAVEPVLRLWVRTFEEKIAREQAIMSAASHGATALGTLALMLAVIGLYGVMAWLVVQRTREIGIRMALGAQAHNVVTLVLRHGMKLVLIGVVIGIPASLAVARVLSSMLTGLTTTDALTTVVVTALLVGVTLLACYLPARRATRVDPLETLRYE
ncbi:MAG TPA: ABC transporter permease [Pyrinomonadaceae bacterium]|nr:ABC transporter permease [Pyrinomonadaceae bacterium]